MTGLRYFHDRSLNAMHSYRRCEDCADEDHCCVRLDMLEARNAIATVLYNRTLAEMRALSGKDEDNLMDCI